MIRVHMLRSPALALAFIAALGFVTACGGAERRAQASQRDGSKSSVADALNLQYNEWKGVRYREGGLSKKGVDCSGFVQLTFRNRLGKSIPRTTKALSKFGKKIRRRSLRPGDLVFFKTGRKVRHVGIYYGDNRFLHASTSRGVMISGLDDIYWGERFWQARRVL